MIGVVIFVHAQQRVSTLCVQNKGMLAVGALRYTVLLAVTPSAWEQGLSGHAQLPSDEGMLFLFPSPSTRSFWMKDMNFPLDIVWIDKDWRVVGVVHHATPASYPSTFISPSPVERVLEISSIGDQPSPIHVGDVMTFSCL
jgi:uncharacterized membrane protein (UPF0127 family)